MIMTLEEFLKKARGRYIESINVPPDGKKLIEELWQERDSLKRTVKKLGLWSLVTCILISVHLILDWIK